MTLWWIGDIVLLVVILPVVVYLLRGVLNAATSIVPSVQQITAAAAAGSKDLDAVPLLLTTQDQSWGHTHDAATAPRHRSRCR